MGIALRRTKDAGYNSASSTHSQAALQCSQSYKLMRDSSSCQLLTGTVQTCTTWQAKLMQHKLLRTASRAQLSIASSRTAD